MSTASPTDTPNRESLDAPRTEGIGARALIAAICVALLALGALPFLPFVGGVPVQPDSMKWIEKGAPTADGWSDWVLHTSHFIGYRPLTALSFTIDLKLFGACPIALRATDLALHLTAAGLLFLLARRLFGGAGALLALAIFVAHPGTDEVLPFLARRSYPIAAVGALSGLLLATRAAHRGWIAFTFVGPMLLLGMFGNELGALLAIALPAVVASAADREHRGRAVLVWLWGWAWIGLGVMLRQRVMDGTGGYPIEGDLGERAQTVASLFAAALPGRLTAADGAVQALLVAVGVYYVAISLALAARRRGLPLALLVVIAVYGGVIAREGVWFPRQIYPATVLTALVAGAVAAATLVGRGRILHAVPQLLALGLVLHASPVLHGASEGQLRKVAVATDFVQDVEASIEALEPPAHVYLVAPMTSAYDTQRAHLRPDWPEGQAARAPAAFRWLQFQRGEQKVAVFDMVYVQDADQYEPPTVSTRPAIELLLPDGAVCYQANGKRLRRVADGKRKIRPSAITPLGPPAYVWIYGGDDLPEDHGTLTQVREKRGRKGGKKGKRNRATENR